LSLAKEILSPDRTASLAIMIDALNPDSVVVYTFWMLALSVFVLVCIYRYGLFTVVENVSNAIVDVCVFVQAASKNAVPIHATIVRFFIVF